MTESLPTSKLTTSQLITKRYDGFRIDGGIGTMKVTIRHDDRSGNGRRNTFSITAIIYRDGREWCCGCCHDDIQQFAPDLAPFIKWHLTSTDGPLHYIANTTYHARQHPANKGYVYMTEPISQREVLLEYCSTEEWNQKYLPNLDTCKNKYRFKPDPKTEKVADLEAARSSAVWPDATLEQLQDKQLLTDRLPALMEEFKRDVESLGFTY